MNSDILSFFFQTCRSCCDPIPGRQDQSLSGPLHGAILCLRSLSFRERFLRSLVNLPDAASASFTAADTRCRSAALCPPRSTCPSSDTSDAAAVMTVGWLGPSNHSQLICGRDCFPSPGVCLLASNLPLPSRLCLFAPRFVAAFPETLCNTHIPVSDEHKQSNPSHTQVVVVPPPTPLVV